MTNPIILLGSARSLGETRKATFQIIGDHPLPFIDLKTLRISPYDYEYQNQDDDFLPLMEQVVTHDLLVLATPVYWYTMSGVMKDFLDRISDLLDIRKNLGRKLRGKKLFVIASFGTSLPNGFEDAFSQTCTYLGMEYLGCSFIYTGGEDPLLMQNNEAEIIKAQRIILG